MFTKSPFQQLSSISYSFEYKNEQDHPLIFCHFIPENEAEQTMDNIANLARKVYEPSIVLPSTILLQWYRVNPLMWWLAKDQDQLIGYISIILLKQDTFRKTIQLGFDEQIDITTDDIRSWNDQSNEHYSLYICSMVVDPFYQKRRDLPVYQLLMKYFFETLQLYGQNGCIIKEWSAIAVSDIGYHICQSVFDLECLMKDDNNHHRIMYGKTNSEHQQQLLQRVLLKLQ